MLTTALSSQKETTQPTAFGKSIKTNRMFYQESRQSAINIREDEEEFLLYMAVPGMRREDFFVCIDKNVIIISDSRKEEDAEWIETFTLPENADPLLISATFINGQLEIHIPKGMNTEERRLLVYVY